MNVTEALAHFMRLHPQEIDLSLDRMARLLSDLDHPERALPPVIHIAGTNGKGSTLAILRALFEAAELTAHVYTSPHLVRFAERIRIRGILPSDDRLAEILTCIANINAEKNITFFEATTAAALYAFAQEKADVCLLETGLGGRLDATNVIQEPKVCILSPIDLDHQDYLGETLRDIAIEKAHILRHNIPAVIAPQHEEALAAIRQHADNIKAKPWYFGTDWSFTVLDTGAVHVTAPQLNITIPPLPLIGPHQACNAALAIVAAHASNMLPLSSHLLQKAIPCVSWPGRLQHLTSGDIVVGQGQNIWLDGGHNPAAAKVIAPILKTWASSGPVDLILGMQTTKDPAGYLQQIAPYVRRIFTVPAPDAPAPMSSEYLAQHATKAGCREVLPCKNWQEALEVSKQTSSPDRTLLIAGSLYLVGRILAANGVGAPV